MLFGFTPRHDSDAVDDLLAGYKGYLVAVGGTGFLYSSDGGTTFTNQTAPTTAKLNQVRVLGNRFFAIGAASTRIEERICRTGSRAE